MDVRAWTGLRLGHWRRTAEAQTQSSPCDLFSRLIARGRGHIYTGDSTVLRRAAVQKIPARGASKCVSDTLARASCLYIGIFSSAARLISPRSMATKIIHAQHTKAA